MATVVVEARERSGALITADFALEEGREVFAVPGEITSALAPGHRRVGECAGMSLDELEHSAGGPFLLKVSLNVLGIS